MAVVKINNYMVFCLNADTKPTNMATGSLCWVTDKGEIWRWAPSAWSLLVPGPASSETMTTKSINLADNTVTDTSAALGDLAYFNGTRFVRFARGSDKQVLQSTTTTINWASMTAENAGIATASGNGSTTVFNIAHGIGSTPSVYSASCMSLTTTFTYTADATNIVVTFSSAPANAANNVKIAWRAIA